MRAWTLFLLLSAAACGPMAPVTADLQKTRMLQNMPSGEMTVLASIDNNIAVDGCAYLVQVGNDSLAPDAASRTLLETFTANKRGTTQARITYRLTGNTAEVQCGWSNLLAAEISISAISPP